MEAHHRLAPRPQGVDTENVEHDVARNRNDIAAIPDQNALLAIDRHLALSPRHDCAEPLAPKQRGGFERHRLQPAASRAGDRRDRKRRDQGNDKHHGHHLDQGKAGAPICGLRSRHRRRNSLHPHCLAHCASSVILSSALMIDTISVPMTTLTTIIVAGPIAPIRRSRLRPSLCS